MGGPPVDVLGEPLGGAHAVAVGLVEVGHVAIGQAQALVDPVADGLLVGLGDAQQHADGAHGHLGAQVLDEVEPALPDQRVEAAGAEAADLGLEVVDGPGREHPGEQAAVEGVGGGILEDDGPGRQVHVGLDDLQQRALRGDVRLPLLRAGVDVLEAAQRIEVVPLVVVDRLLVPQPSPYRVRVGVDLEVVRVVVDVGFRRGHLGPHRCPWWSWRGETPSNSVLPRRRARAWRRRLVVSRQNKHGT